MIPLKVLIIIFISHFIGDFVLQTRNMGNNKSKDSIILAKHCMVYSICFVYFGWLYMILAGLLHFPIDYITSRATSYFWKEKKEKMFFTVIGFDQMLHSIILTFIYVWLK